jgi:hypothetical protein
MVHSDVKQLFFKGSKLTTFLLHRKWCKNNKNEKTKEEEKRKN